MTLQTQHPGDPDKGQIAFSAILAALSSTDPMPDDAITTCLAEFDDIAPHLRAFVTRAAFDDPMSESEIIAFNRALIILAGRRDTEACPALLRLLHRESRTERIRSRIFFSLSGIIAGIFNGNHEALFALTSDRIVAPQYRCVALDAAAFLTAKGTIPRDAMLDFLRSFPIDTVAEENLVLERWIAVIALLGLRELAPLVHHRMTTGDFGDLIENRPDFDELLDDAGKDPAAIKLMERLNIKEIDDIATALAINTEVVEDEPDSITWQEERRRLLRSANVKEILADLLNAPFSRQTTLHACTFRIDDMAPLLQAEIEKAASAEKLSEKQSIALCRCIYVLASVRNRNICKPLLRMLQRSEPPLRFLIEGISPHLTGIIVNLFDWDADSLLALVADSSLAPSLRAGLLNAATYLTFQGRIARDHMAQFLGGFDVDSLTDEDQKRLIESWITAIGLLGFRNLVPVMERRLNASDCAQLKNFWNEEDRFQTLLTTAEERPHDDSNFIEQEIGAFLSLDFSLLWHPVAALSTQPPKGATIEAPWIPKSAKRPPEPKTRGWGPTPKTNAMRNVGRNDPCPCGSGLKAKKCCLANK